VGGKRSRAESAAPKPSGAEKAPPAADTKEPGDVAAAAPPPTENESAALELGRRACAGLTPLEAAKRFELPARRAGVEKEFAEFVADPPPQTLESSGYPRLVAAVYAETVPAKQREEAAAGCAEELALSSSGGQASP
jgi:hypothetical protein